MRKFRFTPKKAAKLKKGQTVEGNTLRPNRALQEKYVRSWIQKIDAMAKDVSADVIKLFDTKEAKRNYAMDASFASMAERLSERSTKKWLKIFDAFADRWADSMVDDFNKQSGVSVSATLTKLAGGLTIKASSISQKTSEMMTASSAEAASLIKTISSEYLSDVSEQVMRAVKDPAAGGFEKLQRDIQSKLNDKYKRVKNHSKNVALDQTRKTFQSLNYSRLRDAGVDEFIWIHSGGAKFPRKDHIAMNGNKYSFNDLPVIDKKTGERGIPGQAYFCRCMMKPVITFGDDDD